MNWVRRTGLVIMIGMIAVACGGGDSATESLPVPTAEPVATATPTAKPVPTATVVPIPTATPTAKPVPTATAVPGLLQHRYRLLH